MFYPKRYSSWPHVCHIILKVSFFFIVMFSYICCNLLSLFFIYLSDLKKPPRQKKKRDKMIIFIAGISMEFSSQFGYITTRGIAAQLFLKILKSVFSKMCVCYYLTGANHYFFGCKRFRQSNINEKFSKKKKRVSLYVQFQKNTRSPTFRPIFLWQFPNFYSSLYTDF